MGNSCWWQLEAHPAMRSGVQANRLLALLVCLVSAGCVASPAENVDCSQRSLNEISLEEYGGHLYTDAGIGAVLIEGTQKVSAIGIKMMVDTGSSVNGLPEIIKEYPQIKTSKEYGAILTPNGYQTGLYEQYIGNIYLGQKSYDNAIFRISAGQAHYKTNSGVLGSQAIFYNDIMDLNTSEHKLTLYYPRGCWSDRRPVNNVKQSEVKRILFRDGFAALFPVKINNIDSYGHFDTGANISLMTVDLAKQLGMLESDFSQDQNVPIMGYGGQMRPAYYHHFKEISVGGVIVPEVDIAVGNFTLPGDAQMDLGTDIWRRINVWYDPAGNKALFYVNDDRK